MTELVDLSMAEAGAALRRGELSSRRLTEAILGRIAATEPHIHAYAHVYGEKALPPPSNAIESWLKVAGAVPSTASP